MTQDFNNIPNFTYVAIINIKEDCMKVLVETQNKAEDTNVDWRDSRDKIIFKLMSFMLIIYFVLIYVENSKELAHKRDIYELTQLRYQENNKVSDIIGSKPDKQKEEVSNLHLEKLSLEIRELQKDRGYRSIFYGILFVLLFWRWVSISKRS